jgi:endo-1,4-beta-xylanase
MCSAARGQYNETNIATAKRMIAAARAKGIKIQGHTLLWHSQLPTWQNNLRTSPDTQEQVLGYLKEYVTYIVNEFKGSIYAWDVLNEVFKDGVSASSNWKTNAMRDGATDGNPWYMKLGADFVYEGFLAARLADPDTILYYNDYSLDGVGKATMVRDMVRDVNAQYATEHPEANGRLLIEGIGMQSHHNANVTAAAITNTLKLFRPLGVKISISELDLLAQTWSDYDAKRDVTTAGLLKQAEMYGQYFQVFLENSDIIERVTFWGVSDASSWRSSGKPLPFDGTREGWTLIPESVKAKPAYYKIIEALENY